MGRKSRLKRERRKTRDMRSPAPIGSTWIDQEGLHAVLPGAAPSSEMMEEMTKQYQKSIRQSPIWDELVRRFGRKKAEELLKECKAELR
jgi:hypothetical protein